MFVGHIAVALAAKRVAPRTNLGLLALGAQWADTLWPVLLLVGAERVEIRPGITVMTPLDFVSYPWSHSLLMLAVWGVLATIAYRRGGGQRAAVVLGALVVSHWVLDVVTHRPDMPLVPFGGPRLGLGLWNHPAAEMLLEGAMYAGGAWFYFRSTRPRDAVGRWAVPALLLTLGAIWLAAAFGPPPPSVDAVAWSGLIGWLFFVWAWWGDAHREPA
ncbi:MAG: hypothetical protein Q8K55_03165 [Gemmatimonadaceae bacterium]|nr:hypothetical protein [Gemmatimonadaceae bacterium]